MNLRRIAATAVFVVSAVGIGAGTSYADPAPAKADDIGYQMNVVEKTIVTTLDKGRFQVKNDDKTYSIEDTAGHAVVQMPLAVNLGNIQIPLRPVLKNDDKTLELTPENIPANIQALPNLLVKPVASPDENLKAQQNFGSQLGIATAVGGLTGTIVGAVIGCGIGAVLGLPFAILPGALGGCAAGGLAGAGLGGLIGTIGVGGPTLIIAGIDLIQTLQAPPGTTKWNEVKPAPEPAPAPAPAN